MRLLFPRQSLCARASYGRYREQSLINKLTNSPPSGRPLLIIVIEYLYSATFLEAHGGLQQKKKAINHCHCPGDMVVGKCAPVQLIGIVKKKYQD